MTRPGLAALAALAALLLGACGGEADPCEGVEGTCLTVRVDSATVKEIDALELDVSWGPTHGTATSAPPEGETVALPLATAVTLEGPTDTTMALEVSVVAAGKLDGAVLG